MPVHLIRRVRNRQPTDKPRISNEFFAKKPIAAFLPGLYKTELVHGVEFVPNNGPTSGYIKGNKTLVSTSGGGSYVGIKAPESASGSRSDIFYDPVAPPLSIVVISTAEVNNSPGVIRGNGSGVGAFSCGAWYGSSTGSEANIRTTGGTLSLYPSGYTVDTRSIPIISVLSIGTATTKLWGGTIDGVLIQESSGATPPGNFYYEYGDDYRLLSIGAGYPGFATNTIMVAMFGVEFSRSDALSIIANPWQIFEPETIPLFFSTVTAQYARPTSDVSTGTWTASSGSDLYAMLDETTASDADYIVTTGASICEVALGTLSDPASSSGHVVRYRISADSGGITVRLRQGTTTIATWTHASAPTSLTTYAQTLTSGEADSITDYTALRLQFEAT